MLTLYIGNKNYSSWSMRPWVLLKQAGIPFEERKIRFDPMDDPDSDLKKAVLKVSPAGRVPVLVDEGFAVWDTLAIAEYLAEKFADKALWPRDTQARARARSICAEMHSGFTALRTHCPMNIEASLSQAGALVWRDQPAVRGDVQRIIALWSDLLAQHQGLSTAGPPQGASAPSGGSVAQPRVGGAGFLFGEFSIADAYYAPVCMRIRSYQLPVPGHITDYIRRVCALPGVKAWMDQSLEERDFLDFEEPYRLGR